MQGQSTITEESRMLNPSSGSSNSITALLQETDHFDLARDFMETVSKTAGLANGACLFEVPGCLFKKPECRAAAIVHDLNELSEGVAFVLHDESSGDLEVYDDTDVPERIRDFIQSYANVLTCLQSLETRPQLH